MKLVIEIPEEHYELRKRIASRHGAMNMVNIAIANGKPLDEVFDEIMAEFRVKADGGDWYHTTDGLVWEEAMEIIEKHRKGESE